MGCWIEQQKVKVKAGKALWTIAMEYIEAPVILRITCAGNQTWSYDKQSNKTCNADGDLAAWSDQALVSSAPLGALVGKVGGSSCDKAGVELFAADKAGAKLFAAGTTCVVVAGTISKRTGFSHNE